ncbi:HAMP domain-containing histidine kinase [Intestinibacillus massiliensis]|uniref:sensor histidine kinase n=1 Tax=Intestinibacillus massiliensis TaxID=1871029 RepID=UPI000B35DAAA|nr:HAMP domain-containing sensor histidine kinase [Intestinibacillus massiliensis]MCB6366175.1 HAMP domain-containing histidine kinase [Intestinibacillus massiliensis]
MAKRTFFVKNFSAYASIILIAFILAGVAFSYQIGKYSLQEKQTQIKQTAINVSEQTRYALANYSAGMDKVYQLFLLRIAKDEDVTILVTDLYGDVQIRADSQGLVAGEGTAIPAYAVQQVKKTGYFSGVGRLDSLLAEESYIVGARCLDSAGDLQALVFVSASNDTVTGMLNHVMRTFFIIVAISMAVVLLMAYVTSSRMTRPLKTMANAAKEFARGDFSVRVPEDNRCDEIDELAVSFNNMASDLEQLEELTRGFIGNVSHEFKTPMTTIGGFVDGMLDGTIPEEQRDKYLHVISEEVHRLSRMVMRMLDAAKIQSGELLLVPAPFDFSEMASQIILSFEQKLDGKHVNVDVEFDDQLIVMGDRDHVFRAVYNLVDNAVKFIDAGGSLTLRARREGAMCAFSIKNTGGGIPAEDIPHIFDRFYKADPSRSRDRTGAGLGLYIVKNIINLHGGDISVRSDGGETEFAFTLPLAQHKKGHGKKEALPGGAPQDDLTKRS